jgi:hypothetical protein
MRAIQLGLFSVSLGGGAKSFFGLRLGKLSKIVQKILRIP